MNNAGEKLHEQAADEQPNQQITPPPPPSPLMSEYMNFWLPLAEMLTPCSSSDCNQPPVVGGGRLGHNYRANSLKSMFCGPNDRVALGHLAATGGTAALDRALVLSRTAPLAVLCL